MQPPLSSVMFVVLSPFPEVGNIIFGKNSERPNKEVQEVVYIKGGFRPPILKCTYITIDQHPSPINSVLLSKPAWMWGAEMGANDKNVAIGNEAVWTNFNEGDGDARVKRLLGMDLVRLGLERGNTAEEAVDVITSLLECHGQGGPCTENDEDLYYHNSFIIADEKEAWVLETSGKFWAAERVNRGYRFICNGLTIKTRFTKHSIGLFEKASELGLWDKKSEFNFAKSFGSGGDLARQNEAERVLLDAVYDIASHDRFDAKKMMLLLRQKDYRVCRGCDDPFPTQGSQVSRLSMNTSVHYMTATPDTSMSYFKPFVFTPNASISDFTTSSNEPQREHYLYKVHNEHIIQKNDSLRAHSIYHMERECVTDLDDRIKKIEAGTIRSSVLDNIMKECVEAEVAQYLGTPSDDKLHFCN